MPRCAPNHEVGVRRIVVPVAELVGVKLAAMRAGRPVTLKATALLKPPWRCTLTSTLAPKAPPNNMVTVLLPALRPKLPAAVTTNVNTVLAVSAGTPSEAGALPTTVMA